MDLWQIILRIGKGVLRRRKRLAVLTLLAALAILGPAAYYLSKEPPRFKTTATILLEARPDRVPLFQEFSPFRPLPVQLAILKSRSLAEGVIDSLPKATVQDLVDNPYYVDYSLELKNVYRRFMAQEPEVESPQRRALKELQQARVTFATTVDGIVQISAEASRPQASVDIVNTYIEVLLARTRTFNQDDAKVSREFLEQQLGDVKRNLNASEQGLRGFVSSHGGVKVPERSQAAVAQLSQVETALAELETNRKMVQTRLQGLREKVETQKRNAPTAVAAAPAPAPTPAPPAPSRSPEIPRLRNQLSQLETTLLDLRGKFTEEHPRIVLTKERIGEVQRQLADVVKETTPTAPAPSAVPPAERINFSEQVVALETAFHTLSAQEDALRRQAEGLRASLKGLSQSELDYSRLVREMESNRSLHSLISDKLTAARIREQGEMKVVKIIDPAGFPLPATGDKRIKFLAAAAMLSLMLGAGLPSAVEWVRKTVENEEDVVGATGLPVLAVVPRLRSRRPLFLSAQRDPGGRFGEDFAFTESFRTLRVSVQFAMRLENLRSVVIASPFASEGKSTVVMNLGLAFREAGQRVVIADTDFQRPTLHRSIKVEQPGGFVDALDAKRNVEESLTPVGDGMWLVPRGSAMQPRTRSALTTDRVKEVIGRLAERAELVLCDSSPILLVPESLFLAAAVDGVILVAKAGSTGCRELVRAKVMLEGSGAKVIGVVINEMPFYAVKHYYKQYYNAYIRSDAK